MSRFSEFPDGMPPLYVPATREQFEMNVATIKETIRNSTKVPQKMKSKLCSRISSDLFIHKVRRKTVTHIGGKRHGPHYYTASIGADSWVIRDENLRLLEVLAAGALAVTTFTATAAASPAVLAVSLVLGCVALADRLRKKKVSLDEKDFKIIMALKTTGPCSAATLASTLGGLHIFGNDLWDEDATVAALTRLQAVRVGDGSIEALVTQASDGLWSVNGI